MTTALADCPVCPHGTVQDDYRCSVCDVELREIPGEPQGTWAPYRYEPAGRPAKLLWFKVDAGVYGDGITVQGIVDQYLVKHGYDGLYDDPTQQISCCGCKVGKLQQTHHGTCWEHFQRCHPGYLIVDASSSTGWRIGPKPL